MAEDRVAYLLNKSEGEGLSDAELNELNSYSQPKTILGGAKNAVSDLWNMVKGGVESTPGQAAVIAATKGENPLKAFGSTLKNDIVGVATYPITFANKYWGTAQENPSFLPVKAAEEAYAHPGYTLADVLGLMSGVKAVGKGAVKSTFKPIETTPGSLTEMAPAEAVAENIKTTTPKVSAYKMYREPNKTLIPALKDDLTSAFKTRSKWYDKQLSAIEGKNPDLRVDIRSALDNLDNPEAVVKSNPTLQKALENPDGVSLRDAIKIKNGLEWKGWNDETQLRNNINQAIGKNMPEMEVINEQYGKFFDDFKAIKKYVNPSNPDALLKAIQGDKDLFGGKPFGGPGMQQVIVDNLSNENLDALRAYMRYHKTVNAIGVPKTSLKLANLPGIAQKNIILGGKKTVNK